MRRKADLPQKMCPVCARPFTWRKKWDKVWDDEDFLMRARVRGFDLAWRWPALENLSEPESKVLLCISMPCQSACQEADTGNERPGC
ncbi:DUF2256 domain-containing protein [Tateyamaria sp.]|uniref:DUF2256 domain-containing protein n=1 Tax=Tateyamaria sp. TaxID=1929288 RepID=UPI003B220A6D